MSEPQRRTISRRQFLFLGTAATALLTAAYVGLRQVGRYEPVKQELRILTSKEAAILQAVGDFLLPPGGPLPGSGGDPVTIARMDAFIADLPPPKARLAAALPLALEHGSALDRFGAKAMTRLSPERRFEYLQDWAESRSPVLAPVWFSARTLFAISYAERPEVLAAMGAPVSCS